jgi:hypothetical protein
LDETHQDLSRRLKKNRVKESNKKDKDPINIEDKGLSKFNPSIEQYNNHMNKNLEMNIEMNSGQGSIEGQEKNQAIEASTRYTYVGGRPYPAEAAPLVKKKSTKLVVAPGDTSPGSKFKNLNQIRVP